MQRPCHIQPAFVNAEGFAQIGVLSVDLLYATGEVQIYVHARRDDHHFGAELPRLPQRHAGLDPGALAGLVLRKDDAVAILHAAADGQRDAVQFRAKGVLNAGIAGVDIGMQNHAIHRNNLHNRY